MDRYIGVDVHASTCTIAVVDARGKRLSLTVVATNGERLVQFFKDMTGRLHVILEEGTQSGWVSEILTPVVHDLAVVMVERRVKGNKDDEEDAYCLAEMRRSGKFKRVYKNLGAMKKLRWLVKSYGYVTTDLVRTRNRLKAAYRSEGIQTGGKDVYKEDAEMAWLPKLEEAHQEAALFLHTAFDSAEALKDAAAHAVVEEGRKHTAFGLLQSIPGLGPIRAAQLLAVVVTPTRFKTKRQFWNYCGFAIMTASSSDWKHLDNGRMVRKKNQLTRGLNWDHNPVMKNVFKGAAKTVVMSTSGPLKADYERIVAKGTRENLALLSLARKIAAITLAVWKSGQPYRENFVPPPPKEASKSDTTLKQG